MPPLGKFYEAQLRKQALSFFTSRNEYFNQDDFNDFFKYVKYFAHRGGTGGYLIETAWDSYNNHGDIGYRHSS